MSKYNFYYDESEHSRKINYQTVSASNYYDNFVTMIVGWSAEKDDILQRHASFEAKYADRKDRNGEIKSTMFQQKQFKYLSDYRYFYQHGSNNYDFPCLSII